MNATSEKKLIRATISEWLRATAVGEIESILPLMAKDVVFLRPGQRPMRGRKAFEKATRSALKAVHVDGKPAIKEIEIAGNHAFCWNRLSLKMTSMKGGATKTVAGDVLTVFRKEKDGRGLIFRDANLLPS